MSVALSQLVTTAPCGEVVDVQEIPLVRCGRPGYAVEIQTTRDGHELVALGRRVTAGPYCADHGGLERARAQALRDWQYLAPASVGDAAAVLEAGAMGLTSRAVYVVIRREEDERAPELWRIRLSREQVETVQERLAAASHRDPRVVAVAPTNADFGARARAELRREHLARLGVAAEIVHVPGRAIPRKRPWLALLGLGGLTEHVGAYPTEAEAETAGRAAWARHVEGAVAAIRAARGGVLDWGVSVEPMPEPVLLRPAAGETGWDLV